VKEALLFFMVMIVARGKARYGSFKC